MKKIIEFSNITNNQLLKIIGSQDRNLKYLKMIFDQEIFLQDNIFYVNDDQGNNLVIKQILQEMYELAIKDENIDERDISYAYRLITKGEQNELHFPKKIIGYTHQHRPIMAKTKGQYLFYEALQTGTVILTIGPAGTGKTYLAIIHAVNLLKQKKIKRIILTRPAVEAGESLGFLPGDLKEKVDPYLTPLYDALADSLGKEVYEGYLEKGIIEIAPLAYMRGRTLDDACVILDEAQNTTSSQMKMFLTRLGNNSKMIITGDISQIDLNRREISGLKEASIILKNIDEIKIVYLSKDDVVRHPVVQKIIESYEKKSNFNK